jgi:hypothetical protein
MAFVDAGMPQAPIMPDFDDWRADDWRWKCEDCGVREDVNAVIRLSDRKVKENLFLENIKSRKYTLTCHQLTTAAALVESFA